MLAQLSIRDLVLIEQVTLELAGGLSVLTGETGAGKSILLDGLNLALGERADASLVRKGAAEAQVTAAFQVAPGHPALALLADNGLPADEPGHILLRRRLLADGGSRAFANDTPISATLLRQLGQLLVEIHGQHDERGLLNPRGHLALLDSFAGHHALLAEMAAAHAAWQQADADLAAAEQRLDADERERDWLQHAVGELRALAPEAGEEQALAEARQRMQQGEKLGEALDQIEALVGGHDGALAQLRQAARRLERIADADEALQDMLDAIDQALVAGDRMEANLGHVRQRFQISPARLEEIETRLFDLRAAARKHRTDADSLAELAGELQQRLAAIDGRDQQLQQRAAAAQQAERRAREVAVRLGKARRAAALRLDSAVAAELPALKLEAARFRTRFEPAMLGALGADQAQFEVRTNAGSDFGPLIRIASGGELSRFTLALKVALAGSGSAGTLVFDEIDRGVGGATASAIGARLARLAGEAQVLVVTHSPQVAAAGSRHFHIGKSASRTTIRPLDAEGRRHELARMLSGAHITEEAHAQAERLLAAPR